MFYRIDTYDLIPRTLPIVEQAFERSYAASGLPAALIGSFHTEFGPLNQIIQIWGFERANNIFTLNDESAGSELAHDISQHVLRVETQGLNPVSFSPELTRGSLGPFFELRTYTYPWDQLDKLKSAWERALPLRNELGSPVAGIWTSLSGTVNSLTHLWPYRSLEEREDLRKKVRETGKWPPYKFDEAEGGTGYDILSQTNKLMLPAAFSPLQ